MKYQLVLSFDTEGELLDYLNNGPDSDDAEQGGIAATGDSDSTGLPWDARIHSKNRTQNPDGTWRKRKGTSDATVKQVEAELRSRPTTTASAPVPPTPPAPVAPPVSAVPSAPPAVVAAPSTPPSPPPAPTAASAPPPAPPPPAAEPTGPDFVAVMTMISNSQQAKLVDDAFINWLKEPGQVGFADWSELAGDQAKRNKVVELMTAHNRIVPTA